MVAGAGRVVRYRCTGCKRFKRGGMSTRWCDDCGGELKRLAHPARKKRQHGR